MKTECPHCHTIFSVTEEQLDLADGKVRCGVCNTVFSALVQDDLFVADADKDEDSLPATSGDEATSAPLVTESDDQPAQEQAGDPESTSPEITEHDTDDDLAVTAASIADDPELQYLYKPEESAALTTESGIDEHAPQLDSSATAEVTELLESDDDHEVISSDKAGQQDIDDAGLFEGSTGYVVPDELREQSARSSLAVSLAWGAGSLLLLIILGAQLAWSSRDQLLQNPTVQGWVETACRNIDCSKLGLRAPDKMEMTSRNVYTHPTAEDALMMTLTIVNRAGFTQGYPDIRVDFSDVVGTTIASRIFSPDEYLALDSATVQPLKPDTPVSFGIEIRDPGKRAMTYEFSFL